MSERAPLYCEHKTCCEYIAECSCRPRHPLKVAMDNIAWRERFGCLHDEIFGVSGMEN